MNTKTIKFFHSSEDRLNYIDMERKRRDFSLFTQYLNDNRVLIKYYSASPLKGTNIYEITLHEVSYQIILGEVIKIVSDEYLGTYDYDKMHVTWVNNQFIEIFRLLRVKGLNIISPNIALQIDEAIVSNHEDLFKNLGEGNLNKLIKYFSKNTNINLDNALLSIIFGEEINHEKYSSFMNRFEDDVNKDNLPEFTINELVGFENIDNILNILDNASNDIWKIYYRLGSALFELGEKLYVNLPDERELFMLTAHYEAKLFNIWMDIDREIRFGRIKQYNN